MKLLIIFGGMSNEHEVSRASTASILKMIRSDKYEVTLIGIKKTGEWWLTKATPEEIFNGDWEYKKDNRKAFLSPDASVHGIVTDNGEKIKIDCVWPVLHGKNGEDGTIQGLCELAGLKYVGPGVCSSAMCMDKITTKMMVNYLTVEQAEYYAIDHEEYMICPENVLEKTEEFFNGKYPLFVKPAISGSSVGISKALNREDLRVAYDVAFSVSSRVLVEEEIIGKEVEVAVLGNSDPKASKVGEIMTNGEWYDYDSKYGNRSFNTTVPARITKEEAYKTRQAALQIYKLMGCRGIARVDFFVTDDGKVIFNEINTLPGFTEISMYPKLWNASGLSYVDLIDKIVELAVE